MNKIVVFLDLDGVLANFDHAITLLRGKPYVKEEDPPEMFEKDFFRKLPVMPGAKEGVKALLSMPHLAVYIGTKFSNKNTHSATEKLDWLYEHFPELAKNCMLSCDKSLLNGHFLVDDDRKWENKFPGMFIHFNPETPAEENWKEIVARFELVKQPTITAHLDSQDQKLEKALFLLRETLDRLKLQERCIQAADDLRTHYLIVRDGNSVPAFKARLNHWDELREKLDEMP